MADSRDESVLTLRLEELEQRVADHDMTLTEQDSSFSSTGVTSRRWHSRWSQKRTSNVSFKSRRDQIEALTGQIGNLRSTIDDLRDLIREMKSKN